MQTYYVKQGEIYKVTATINCALYDDKNEAFASCDAGQTLSFAAPSDKIVLSDDNAALERTVGENSELHASVVEHLANSNLHVTAEEKASWNETFTTVTEQLPDMNAHINDTTVHITAKERTDLANAVAHIDDPTLHERVLNIGELYPSAGSGDNYDRFTMSQAVSLTNQYITIHGLSNKVTAGLKIKYKDLNGKIVEVIWNGEDITNVSNWGVNNIDEEVINEITSHVYNEIIHMTTEERESLEEVTEIVHDVFGGYEIVSDRSCEGTVNMSIHWAQVCVDHVPSVSGELVRVVIPCQTSIEPTEMSSDPLYLGIWNEEPTGNWVKLGVSNNTVSQVIAADSDWYFDDGVKITTGMKLRFGLLSDPANDFSDTLNWVLGGRGVDSEATCAHACYVKNLSSIDQYYMLDVTLECRSVVYHSTTVTEEERNTWNEVTQYSSFAGEIKYHAGTTVPEGYLLCDGSAISRTDYARLFEAIGTTWGEGDGSTTFLLPNLIDRVIWGAATSGEYLEAGLPNITGSFAGVDTSGVQLSVNGATGAFTTQSNVSNYGIFTNYHDTTSSGNINFNASRSSAIYGSSDTVQPPAAKVMPIIRY